jgi:hypothetical protein
MAPFNRDRAATILVEAAYFGDQPTSEKWVVTTRTIQRYRARLDGDKQLSQLVADKKLTFEGAWASELPGAILAGIAYLKKAPENLAVNAEGIHAVAGAVKLLSSIETTKRMLDARLKRNEESNAGS